MKNFGLVVAVSLLLCVLGCQDNSASLIILQNQIPGTGCTVESSSSGTHRPQGTLDVLWYTGAGQPAGYYMFPLLQNNLISTEDTSTGQIEHNCLTVKEAEVDLDLGNAGGDVDGDLMKYKVSTAVTICPGEMRAVSVMVIPPQIVEMIAGGIPENGTEYANVTIRMVSKRGRTTIKSSSMSFPIKICNGCLINNLGDCSSPGIPEDPATGNECNPAQDDPLECCVSGVDWVCPAESTYEVRPEE